MRRGHVAVANLLPVKETTGGYRRVDKLLTDAIVSAGSLPTANFLVKMRCDSRFEKEMSSFLPAAEHGWVVILQYLLEPELNVNTDDSNVRGNAVKTAIYLLLKKAKSMPFVFSLETRQSPYSHAAKPWVMSA